MVLSQIQDGKETEFMYGNERLATHDIIFITDGLQNVSMIQSTQGSFQESYTYSAYGQRDIQYNPFIQNNEYGYHSEAHTPDGQQYLRARIYDSKTTTFIQEDSYLGDVQDPTSRNRYTYGRNNPYKYSDPSGHKSFRKKSKGPSYSFSSKKKVTSKSKSKPTTVKKTSSSKASSTVKKKVSSNSKSSWNQPKKVVKNNYTPPYTASYTSHVAKAKPIVTTKVRTSLDNQAKAIVNLTKSSVSAQVSKVQTKSLSQQLTKAKLGALNSFTSGVTKKYPPKLGSLSDRVKGICKSEEDGYDIFKSLESFANGNRNEAIANGLTSSLKGMLQGLSITSPIDVARSLSIAGTTPFDTVITRTVVNSNGTLNLEKLLRPGWFSQYISNLAVDGGSLAQGALNWVSKHPTTFSFGMGTMVSAVIDIVSGADPVDSIVDGAITTGVTLAIAAGIGTLVALPAWGTIVIGGIVSLGYDMFLKDKVHGMIDEVGLFISHTIEETGELLNNAWQGVADFGKGIADFFGF